MIGIPVIFFCYLDVKYNILKKKILRRYHDLLRRMNKLIMLGVLSCMFSNTFVFATEDKIQSETQAPETQVLETQAPETQAPEIQAPETQTPETQAPETQVPETQAPETQVPETQMPETQAPETQAPEAQTPETQTPETQTPETQTPETQTPETQTPETQASEIQILETQASEKKSLTSHSGDANIIDSPDEARKAAELEGIKQSPYATNEELIAHQNIISVKHVTNDFRFTQVEADRAIVKAGSVIYEEKRENSRIVGKAKVRSLVYILADGEAEWVYIESGDCRGFVKRQDMITGNVAEFILSRNGALQDIDSILPLIDNAATTYTNTSVYKVVVPKDYAIVKADSDIYDGLDVTKADIIGSIRKDGLVYILKDINEFYFVESGNVRGFIAKKNVISGHYADVEVSKKSESSFSLAQEKIAPENNKACFYTLTSIEEAGDMSAVRSSVVDFALQFVGNPYVWGGTSLTNGADCSGFVQSIYASFGYDLPRVACDQAGYGTQIPISDAEPGDLIFYAKNGYVYHVSMYIGNGQVVQAYSTKAGIITSDIGPNAVWATKILS